MSKPYISVVFFLSHVNAAIIPCECGKVYIGETGTAMQDRIKEYDRDIRLAHTQTSAVSEHANETGHLPIWNQVKFIDRDPHRYTRRVKEATQIRLHSNNMNSKLFSFV